MTISIPAPNWLTPVISAFAGSLVLSLVARLGSTINRDGMLYINVAQAYLDGGLPAAMTLFKWPFLSIAIAIISRASGLPLEAAAYLLNAFFMAGACALTVAAIARRSPELAWTSCLVVLALPGLNEYRNEVLREFGCWFFLALAWWLALRWEERPRWTGALATQSAIAAAALFRPEAVAMYAALVLWQAVSAPRAELRWRLAMLSLLPLLGAALFSGMYAGGYVAKGSRLASEMERLSATGLNVKAGALSGELIEFARSNARTILFFGSLALVPIKIFQKFGILLLPLAWLFVAGDWRNALRQHAIFAAGIAAHLIVLAVFVIDLQFVAGRYTGPVLLFATPFVALGLRLLSLRFSRWRPGIVAACVLLAIANVVSIGHGKTHLVEAGHWLTAQATDPASVYIDSERTAYHAGWPKNTAAPRNDRDAIRQAVAEGRHALFVLEHSRKDPPLEGWLQENGLRIIRRFDHPGGDAVIIAARTITR